jgi:hypothetical protein
LIDRVRGIERLYETKVTDGYREATGRGATIDDSKQTAQRKWETNYAEQAAWRRWETDDQTTEMTEFDASSAVQSSAVNAGDSNLGALRELIDALRADNARLLRWLIKRGIDGPEHEKLAEILLRHSNFRDYLQRNVDEERAA